MESDTFQRRWGQVLRWVGGVAAFLLFLLSIQLLKGSVEGLAPSLRTLLPRIIRGDLSALGTSWLVAYLLLNGSVVAALALTLFNAALLTAPQLLLMIFGSRLGAAGIVLLVGVVDFFQRRALTIRKASELGIIAFLVTHTVGLPATLAGYLWVRGAPLGGHYGGVGEIVRRLQVPAVIERGAEALISLGGPLLGLGVGVGGLMLSLRLFNGLFETTDFECFRARFRAHLDNHWIAFGVGLGLTAMTTSIAFSLGMIVPVYNRRFLRRSEVIPYILGANVGTLLDTVLISFFTNVGGAVAVTLLVVVMTALMTLLALLWFDPYRHLVEGLLERITADRWAVLAFLGSLALAPLGLIGLDWGLG